VSSQPIRPELRQALDALIASGQRSLTLDQLSEAIGLVAVSSTDVEALMDGLEAAGVQVQSPDPVDLQQELQQVIRAARTLRDELGRAPHADEIAPRAGLDGAAVRRALLFARVLSRG
jgi:hypothetical protein